MEEGGLHNLRITQIQRRWLAAWKADPVLRPASGVQADTIKAHGGSRENNLYPVRPRR